LFVGFLERIESLLKQFLFNALRELIAVVQFDYGDFMGAQQGIRDKAGCPGCAPDLRVRVAASPAKGHLQPPRQEFPPAQLPISAACPH